MELDHMTPRAEGGTDDIDNAIAVCFECHAEIHSYNDQHPRGRKFRPEELRQHKEQWLNICRENPSELLSATRDRDVGPLQSMLDELTFNESVACETQDLGCLFLCDQFRRAIHEGAISILETAVQDALIDAYRLMGKANEHINADSHADYRMKSQGTHRMAAQQTIDKAQRSIREAKNLLIGFLSHESD